jgi:dGTPase
VKLCQEIQDIQREKGEDSTLNLVQMLEHQYHNGVNRKVKDPQLYAVQNWVVRLQSSLIFAATKGFTSHYDEIMNGSYGHDIFYGTEAKWASDALGDIAYRYAFTSRPILKLEVAAGTILNFLLDRLVPAAVHYDTADMTDMMEQKMISLISENYVQTYHICAKGKTKQEKLYLRLLLVTDFLSGMTDSYAKNLYQELNGIA